MATLLVVDDEAKIRKVIREYAEFDGHTVVEARDGAEAVAACMRYDIDVIVMDIMMPNMDGFTAYRNIKKHKDIPAIMLSARGEEYDKLYGFEMGIDDYMVKPFSPKELMARLGVVVSRRNGGLPQSGEKHCFEGLELDFSARTAFVDGEMVLLTPREYDLLFFLARNKNIVFSRDHLLQNVWGFDFEGDTRTVDTHIKLLRKSLGEYRKFIVTSRGAGYKFEI